MLHLISLHKYYGVSYGECSLFPYQSLALMHRMHMVIQVVQILPCLNISLLVSNILRVGRPNPFYKAYQSFVAHANYTLSARFKQKPKSKKEKTSICLFEIKKVARDGIEPPTQGFSVLCSTD